MAKVFIGMGSNVGDRMRYLESARTMLACMPDFTLRSQSSVDETEPVEYVDQPRFLNQIVCGETALPPSDVLQRLFDIENALGRKREIPKGPRTIDLDLLLYDDLVYCDERLVLPHPGIRKRPFVMKQLIELDGKLKDPMTGETYWEVYRRGTNSEHP
jgi:2-amino-4-hydroxy-6-hydroxymethyldihydropteridine diphosphokinase